MSKGDSYHLPLELGFSPSGQPPDAGTIERQVNERAQARQDAAAEREAARKKAAAARRKAQRLSKWYNAKPNMEDILTVDEAAVEIGIAPGNLRLWILRGRLPATKFGTAWAIRRDDLEAFREWWKANPRVRIQGSKD